MHNKLNSKIEHLRALSIVLVIITLPPIYSGGHGTGIVALVSAIFVWLASYNSGNISSFGLGKQLVWLGKHSYAIYLIHLVIIRSLFEIAFIIHSKTSIQIESLKYLILLLSIFAIFFLAYLNYKYIENPLRKKGKIKADNFLSFKLASKKIN